jgi:hypothetical protein
MQTFCTGLTGWIKRSCIQFLAAQSCIGLAQQTNDLFFLNRFFIVQFPFRVYWTLNPSVTKFWGQRTLMHIGHADGQPQGLVHRRMSLSRSIKVASSVQPKPGAHQSNIAPRQDEFDAVTT